NVTQNIKSQKKDNGTEITINSIYETDVKNSTLVVKNNKAELLALKNTDSSDHRYGILEDRLSEHEEYEESIPSDKAEARRQADYRMLCDRFNAISMSSSKEESHGYEDVSHDLRSP